MLRNDNTAMQKLKTEIPKRFKLLKTCLKMTKPPNRQTETKKTENCLGMIIWTKYQNTIFLTKNSFFDQTALISAKTCCLKTTNTDNNTKTQNWSKTPKTGKAH